MECRLVFHQKMRYFSRVTAENYEKPLETADFDFDLPPDLIAQHPPLQRGDSRLLQLNRQNGQCAHRKFTNLPDLLQAGDVLVLNNTRVLPARLRGQRTSGGAAVECLLLTARFRNQWWALLRPGKRFPSGSTFTLLNRSAEPTQIQAEVQEKNPEGHALLQFTGTEDIEAELPSLGEMPLPPYIERGAFENDPEDAARYQTVYAQAAGSVAAPTAGLHFTDSILEAIQDRGVTLAELTLHVGLGTFAPVKAERVAEHAMHTEHFSLPAETVSAIKEAKAAGGRVIAVGTTSTRVLESATAKGPLRAMDGSTDIFIYPPHPFRVVDGLITNFHLPRSTLLMLVSAFAGREAVLAAYVEAVREKYRFFSYGDAMFIA